MAEKFNPFHKWLGLSEKIKNPHHFQLLGVSPSVTDEDQIRKTVEESVQRHLATLAKLPPGKFDDIRSKLTKRIADAQKILLNPQVRSAYLAKLKAQVVEQQQRAKAAAQAKHPAQRKQKPGMQPPATKPVPPGSQAHKTNPAQPVLPQPAAQVPPAQIPAAAPSLEQDVLFQATGPEPGSFPEPGANPQHGMQQPNEFVAPVVEQPGPPLANPAIPMALPVAPAEPPGQPVATAAPESGEIGEVIINRSMNRKKKNKWIAPIIALILVGIGGAGAYSIYHNFEEFAKKIGIRKDIYPGPGVIREDENPLITDPPNEKLNAPSLEDLDEVNVDEIMNDPATQKQTGRDAAAEAKLKNMLDGEKSTPSAGEMTPPSDNSVNPQMAETGKRQVVMLDEQQSDRFRRSIQRLRRSLFRRDKKVAIEQIAEAQGIIKEVVSDDKTALTDNQKHLASIVDSSDKLISSIEGFWNQVIAGTTGLAGGQVIKIKDVEMGFLEADNEKFIVRHNGTNVTYQYFYTPPGLAVALGNQGKIASVPTWSMQQAAFYAVNQIAGSDHQAKVDELLNVAEAAGFDGDYIREFASFDFESLGPDVNKIVSKPGEIFMLIKDFRETNDYEKPLEVPYDKALSLSEILLSLDTDNQKQRISYLKEARLLAIQAMDPARVEDAVAELDRYAKIDRDPMLLRAFHDISKNRRIAKSQIRGLMEMAIPLLKSDRGKAVDRKFREPLVKQLTKLAQRENMVDCVWRLEQIGN